MSSDTSTKEEKKGEKVDQESNGPAQEEHESTTQKIADILEGFPGGEVPQEGGAGAAASDGEVSEWKEKYLRVLADFENFKKRTIRDRAESLKYQGEQIFQDLLEVVDNFERAMSFADSDAKHLAEGLSMIHQSFQSFLAKWQVKGDSAVGEKFDPKIHSALSQVPATEPGTAGTVVNELKKPYFYKDKLLRPGEVVVAIAPEKG